MAPFLGLKAFLCFCFDETSIKPGANFFLIEVEADKHKLLFAIVINLIPAGQKFGRCGLHRSASAGAGPPPTRARFRLCEQMRQPGLSRRPNDGGMRCISIMKRAR
jgi:hypothetical protein